MEDMMWTPGRLYVLSRQAAAAASTRGSSGGNYKSTEASIRGECSEDGWVPCGGLVPLYWWFFSGVVSSLAIYVGSTSSDWVKSLCCW